MTAQKPALPGRDPEPLQAGIGKDRVAALFDGIVAITATLLILDIGVPPAAGALDPAVLMETARSVLHWIVSFVMVAVIWTEFHVVFAHARRWDGAMLAASFALMALVSLIPFAAKLVGTHPDSFWAALAFAGVMGANGLMLSANIALLQNRDHLHAAPSSGSLLGRRRRAQLLIYPACLAISLVGAWLHDPVLGVLAWAACPLALAAHLRRSGGTPGESMNRKVAA